MERIRKILILGSGGIQAINILCENLLRFGDFKYQFSGINLYNPGKGGITTNYDHIDDLYEIYPETSIRNISRGLIIKYLKKKFTLIRFIELVFQKRFKYRLIRRHIIDTIKEADYRFRILNKISEYEVVNVHYLSEWQSEIVPLIPENIWVVITPWGSDVMATAGPKTYALQYEAMQRANAITVTGPETEQIVLSKFGRNLKSKIHYTFIGLSENTVNSLRSEKERYLDIGNSLLKRFNKNASDYKYIIKLGYSAYETQNHIAILNEMSKLPGGILSNLLFIIPMTYGEFSEGYKEKVEQCLIEKTLNGIVLKDYLASEEAVSLSFISNIMFNLRDNDSFNNSMTESLIAGAVVFNGIWLPYKILKQKNVHYIDVYNINGMSVLFEEIISDFESHKKKSLMNAGILEGFISGKGNVENWEKALYKVQIHE